MNTRRSIVVPGLLAGGLALASCAMAPRSGASRADDAARWFKGNTHTHTYWSDGNAAPEHVVDWYAEHGYDFLVLSDHNILSRGEKWFPISTEGSRPLTPDDVADLERRFGPDWVVERANEDGTRAMRLKTLAELRARFECPESFILIEGEEITDSFERHEIHVNGLNLAELIPPQGGDSVRETIQRNIDAVIAQGRRLGRPVLAHVNHPNYVRSLTPADVAAIEGERFFEVYNGHRGVLNHGDDETPSTERLWDVALTLRLTEFDLGLLYGLATDDAHDHHGRKRTSVSGRGWVHVRATALTPDAIIEAMRAGDFHASNGVTLTDVAPSASGLRCAIAAEDGVTYTTEFIGTRLVDGAPGEVGAILATTTDLHPSYTFRGDELYVRARVVSSKPHPDPFAEGDLETAWVQPVLGPAAP